MLDKINDKLSEFSITIKALIVVVILIVITITSVLIVKDRFDNNSRNKLVNDIAEELIVPIEEAENDNNINTTIDKVVRDYKKNNKNEDVIIEANKINDCLYVIVEHNKGNKSIKHSGNCLSIRNDSVVNVNNSDVIKVGDTVKFSGSGFIAFGNNNTMVLKAPDFETEVEVSVNSDGSFETELLIPDKNSAVGVWGFSVSDDVNTVEGNFIVEK